MKDILGTKNFRGIAPECSPVAMQCQEYSLIPNPRAKPLMNLPAMIASHDPKKYVTKLIKTIERSVREW